MGSNNLAIRLTDKQLSFVREVSRGRKPSDAARASGFAEPCEEQAFRLLHTATVAAAIRLEITRLLTVEALPLAYGVLTELARDPACPPAVRRACARDLIDRAGFVAPKAATSDNAGQDKPLSEMNNEELKALVDKLESELGARAVDVTPSDNAPSSAPAPAKALEFLD